MTWDAAICAVARCGAHLTSDGETGNGSVATDSFLTPPRVASGAARPWIIGAAAVPVVRLALAYSVSARSISGQCRIGPRWPSPPKTTRWASANCCASHSP